jgi:hypothetical protein
MSSKLRFDAIEGVFVLSGVPNVNKPLSEHIKRLEKRLVELNQRSMENRLDLIERNRVEAEIRAATQALDHYKTALELEHRAWH